MPTVQNWMLSDYLGTRLVTRQTRFARFFAILLHLPFKPWGFFGLLALFYLITH